MKDQSPYVAWYHGDFLRSTAGWTLLERAAYWMLLCAEWEIGPLPSEPERLASIAGVYPEEFIVLWKQQLKSKFTSLADGRLINERMEMHRQKYLDFRRKQSEGGKKGMASRYGNRGKRSKIIEFPPPK